MPKEGELYLISGERWLCVCVGETFCTLVAGRGRRWVVPLSEWPSQVSA